jgi:hypothetical protein
MRAFSRAARASQALGGDNFCAGPRRWVTTRVNKGVLSLVFFQALEKRLSIFSNPWKNAAVTFPTLGKTVAADFRLRQSASPGQNGRRRRPQVAATENSGLEAGNK